MLVSVGRYKIEEQIGSGAMGRVYRALDTTLDRQVALKAIETGPTLDPDLKERFYREARLCARLQHPNIVTVFDLGESDGYAYIAMELLFGRNLKQIIEARDPVPLRQKVEAIAQACEALAHAHRSGLVHRDLKPSNIFRVESGQVKILDFGIARMPSSMLTVAGLVLGTPNYMAPEQILGQTLDGRADLFSVAIVLFCWIAFEHPFRADSIPKRIASQPPERLLNLAPWAGPDLDSLLSKALSRDPRDRFQTGDELAQALRRAVMGASTEPVAGFIPQPQAAPVVNTPAVPEEVAGPPADSHLEPPPGEDPSEWRISRFLSALQEFDEAYEVRAVGVAAEALRTVEQLAREDDRFQIAAAEYRSRLEELENSTKPAAPSLPVALQPVPPFTPAKETVAATNPASAAQPNHLSPPAPVREPQLVASAIREPVSISPTLAENKPEPSVEGRHRPVEISDATRLLTAPMLAEYSTPRQAAPVPPRSEPASAAFSTTASAVAEATPVPSALYQNSQPVVPTASRKTKRSPVPWLIKIFGGLAIVGAFFLLLHPLFRQKPYAVAASYGEAQVAADHTRLVSGSEGDGKLIAELKQGDRVNILNFRPDPRSAWTSVQYVGGGGPLEPGYVPLGSLTGWSRFALLEGFKPGPSANDEQRSHYLAQLTEFLKTAPPEEADQARLAKAEEQLTLARSAKANGQAASQIEELVRTGEGTLSGLSANSAQTPEAQALASSFRNLTSSFRNLKDYTPSPVSASAAIVPPPQDAPSGNVYSPELDFNRATNAFEKGEYERAKRALSRVLRHDPNNRKAQSFLGRVQAAQKIDPGTGR